MWTITTNAIPPSINFIIRKDVVHFGGDEALARGFAEMLEGAPSPLGLEHGLASAAVCLAARRAAQTHREETIEYGF